MMSNEELVSRIQQGERDRIEELWTQVERFVRQQARRISQTNGITEDDLYQSGYLALVAAVNSYDPTQGMSFIGWLVLHLKTAFAKAGGWRSRKRDPLSAAYSLDAPVNEDGATLGDLQSGPGGLEEMEDQIWREQLHEALERALAALPEEQEILPGANPGPGGGGCGSLPTNRPAAGGSGPAAAADIPLPERVYQGADALLSPCGRIQV